MARKVQEQCDTPDCDDPAIYHKNQSVAANQLYLKRQRRTAARIEQSALARKSVRVVPRPRARSEARVH